jgi:hypothetical protein
MKQLSYSFPSLRLQRTKEQTPEQIIESLEELVNTLKKLHKSTTEAINFNAITTLSQNGQPTPLDGQWILWHDADAAAGQPTHYIVTNMAGTVRTFRSVEVV